MIISFSKLGGGGGGSVPIATRDTAGIVKVGSGLTIDSGGTLSQEVISIDLANKSQSELATIWQFVTGHTNDYRFQFTWVIPGGEPIWATSVNYNIDGNDGSIYLTFLNREGVSWWGYLQPSGNMQYLGSGKYADVVANSLISNSNYFTVSGSTVALNDTSPDEYGRYWYIMNMQTNHWLHSNFDELPNAAVTPTFQAKDLATGKVYQNPRVNTEPSNQTFDEWESDLKVTLDYEAFKIEFYIRDNDFYIAGLTVTQNPITKFWKGTQAQYDALAPNYDNNTLYVIV